MALPCVLAFSQLHGAGTDSAPNVGSESSVTVQDCYINAFKAKIVPERIRSFAMPADGIVSNWIPAEGRVRKDAIIATVNEDEIEMERRELEVKILKDRIAKEEELSELENSLSEPYEMQEENISAFCENVMNKIRGKVQEDVSLIVNAPKLNIKINPEHLERILLHLLENAAEYTPAGGKIGLDFKKRGAHTHQFIISDTGCGIAEEQRENIFKPFTEVKDLTQGDGLGLPICALIATKMDGSLTLDSSYAKGTRFVLELHA